jgi:hypothetical protein
VFAISIKTNNFAVKKPKKKIRNPFAINAKKRKAGKIRSKKEKRQNGKNEQQELLKETDDV